MGGMADLQQTLFTAQEPANGSFTYSSAIQARKYSGGVDLIEADAVALAGIVNSLGSATLLTFQIETAPTSSGPWSPLGLLDAPVIAAGFATSALNGFRFTRSATGAIPSVSFTPDQAYFRVGVQANAASASVDLTAFVSQKE